MLTFIALISAALAASTIWSGITGDELIDTETGGHDDDDMPADDFVMTDYSTGQNGLLDGWFSDAEADAAPGGDDFDMEAPAPIPAPTMLDYGLPDESIDTFETPGLLVLGGSEARMVLPPDNDNSAPDWQADQDLTAPGIETSGAQTADVGTDLEPFDDSAPIFEAEFSPDMGGIPSATITDFDGREDVLAIEGLGEFAPDDLHIAPMDDDQTVYEITIAGHDHALTVHLAPGGMPPDSSSVIAA